MAEEAAEKMAAVKRAYAEIILNMAQEAAARILASEQKAVGFQQSLSAAKEEALAALLRLKSMMDSKVSEAQKVHLVQASRIQELEVQLTEAESMIGHLRTDLKRVNGELEKVKNRIVVPLRKENSENLSICSSEDKCEGSRITSDHMISSPHELVSTDVEKTSLSLRNADGSCCCAEYATKIEPSKDVSEKNECSSNSDLASIIMASKEPELYRNGCTQRIRAFEQNHLAAKVPIRSEDHVSNTKNDLPAGESGKAENPCTPDSSKMANLASEVKKSAVSERDVHVKRNENGQALKFFRRTSSGRRAKSKYINSSHSEVCSDEGKVGHQRSKTECSRFSGDDMNAHNDSLVNIVSEDDKEFLHSSGASFSSRSCRTSNGGKMCSNIALRNESLGSLQNSRRVMRLSTPQNIRSGSEDRTSRSPSLISVKGDDNLGVSILLNETKTKDAIPLTRGIQDDVPDTELVEDSASLRPIQKIANDTKMTSSESTHDSGHIPIANLDPKGEKPYESVGISNQAGGDRVLKYRRKRKRGFSSGKDENIFPEKRNNAKRKAIEKQNSMVELQNPSLKMESSRDSRRVAQVARQLISLSEKRWW